MFIQYVGLFKLFTRITKDLKLDLKLDLKNHSLENVYRLYIQEKRKS